MFLRDTAEIETTDVPAALFELATELFPLQQLTAVKSRRWGPALMLRKNRVRQDLEEGAMDDLPSALATMFTWLGDGAVAFAARWFRGLRRK